MSLLQNSNAIPQLGGYNLTDSVRFRSSAGAVLERTPSSTGNRRTFTWSCWIKRGSLSSTQTIFRTIGSSDSFIRFTSSDAIEVRSVGTWQLITSNLFRDTSAWYHIIWSMDTTESTSTDRAKVYINGEQVTSFSTSTYPTSNYETSINQTNKHTIGRYPTSSTELFDGYMTEVNFVDGQALTASDFGETDTITGVWQPKKYTGTYGTNGFYLDMSTSGSTVTDQSGNGNDWTATNMNLTTSTATTYDIMSDVPTLTDEDTANFATLNPLIGAGSVTVSLANLKSTAGTNAQRSNVSTTAVSSGKYYWETTWNQVGANDAAMTGIIGVANLNPNSNFGGTNSYVYVQDGGKQGAGSYTAGYGDRYVAGDVIGTALDLDGGTITFYRNGVSQGTAFSSLPSVEYYLGCSFYNSGDNFDINFGQRPFAYTPPTGYKKLNTYNLPDSTIADGSKYFDTKLWTGNGTSQTISGLEFAPDLVWGKSRSVTGNHVLVDSIRGDNTNLSTNLANVESSGSSISNLVNGSFDVAGGGVNASSVTMVGWSWRGSDSSAVSNTDGDIASTVSANTTSGFSVVSWTADNSASTRIGHGLGTTPKIAIIKNRDTVSNWQFYTTIIDGTYDFFYLNLTNAKTNSGLSTFTSTTFAAGGTNTNTDNMIAYCFAEVEGFSKFGSYTGNGSADGTFVYTGFRPAMVIMKVSSGVSNWTILDDARDTYNVTTKRLQPNLSNAEDTPVPVDFLSNGFKHRSTNLNGSGDICIYMAFAKNPFKNSLAR